MKPICKSCNKKDKVVKVNYQRVWQGYECERCYEVVAEIYDHNISGNKVKYEPYRLTQV